MNKQSKPSSRTTKADLEKALAAKTAELQQRDRLLEIEAALERVRAKALAMHGSEDLAETIKVFYEQIGSLTVIPRRCGVALIDGEEKVSKVWTMNTTEAGESVNVAGKIRMEGHPVLLNVYEHWLMQKDYYSVLRGQEIKEYYQVLHPQVNFPDYPNDVVQYGHYFMFPEGDVYAWTEEQLKEEELDIYRRFTSVLSLTYRRYFDLMQAEAQTREAQIEAALERIRGKVTSMQESSELLDIVVSMRKEFVDLGHDSHYFWYMRWLPEKYEKAMTSGDGTRIGMIMELPRHMHGSITLLDDWEKSSEPAVVYAMDVEAAVKYVDKMIRLGDFKQVDPNAPTHDDIRQIGGLTFVMARTSQGEIGYSLPGAVPDPPAEDVSALVRFAGVFDLAYRRFEDLKEAERRNRETQIELALERVRARSLAMHKAEELGEVVTVVVEKLRELDIPVNDGVAIVAFIEGSKDLIEWMENPGFPSAIRFYQPYFDHPVLSDFWKARNEGLDFIAPRYTAEENRSFLNQIFEFSDYKHTPQEIKDYCLAADTYSYSAAFQKNSSIFINDYSGRSLSEQEIDIVKRFSKVFEQAYVRFLDLQKAEEQAKESQIEAALERVRAKAMAMHSSEDISDATAIVFTELKKLGIETVRCGIIIIEETKFVEVWTAVSSPKEGEIIQVVGRLDMTQHRMLSNAFDAWKRKDKFFSYDLFGTDLEEYYTYLTNAPEYSIPEYTSLPERHTLSIFFFPEGGVFSFTDDPQSVETHAVFERFANVFALTYRRYLDLVKAEGQAREAVKQASLDRVRAEIASMRTTDDLNRITPLIWRELTTLGVPFFRCGVFIVDEPSNLVRFYLSTPSGDSLAAMNLNYGTTPLVDAAVDSWREERVFIEKWNRDQFIEWTKSILEQGLIESPEKYQAGEAPPEILVLQFVPFKQGMLYVGSAKPLAEDQIELAHALANAFAVAYARYEDFKQLEEAKHRVEGTLHELKSAQSQLIQSEKMASLGELTAGIAHEIQNPLNFVNNFSEVNAELLEELNGELQNGNMDEAVSLIKDMLENEHKVIHHGRRAEAIVKSMLQHSRGSSGKSEPTDINELADEYLRLAYHGMRARDKSFNASMETDFDDSIGNLNVVPQEIGRVLLNLITNAFYAVTEKQKLNGTEYQPTITVTTKKQGDQVEIRVKDNGTGIPQKVLDKIFQPFFSTKPTGQGTGLGLSLSYDIVKAHGGELTVETEEGAGSEFVVYLPV